MSNRDDLFDRSKESEVICIVIWYGKFTNWVENWWAHLSSDYFKERKFYIVKGFDKLRNNKPVSSSTPWTHTNTHTNTHTHKEKGSTVLEGSECLHEPQRHVGALKVFLRWRKSPSGEMMTNNFTTEPKYMKTKNKHTKKRQVHVNNLSHIHPDSIRYRFYTLIVKICPDSVTIKQK